MELNLNLQGLEITTNNFKIKSMELLGLLLSATKLFPEKKRKKKGGGSAVQQLEWEWSVEWR